MDVILTLVILLIISLLEFSSYTKFRCVYLFSNSTQKYKLSTNKIDKPKPRATASKAHTSNFIYNYNNGKF